VRVTSPGSVRSQRRDPSHAPPDCYPARADVVVVRSRVDVRPVDTDRDSPFERPWSDVLEHRIRRDVSVRAVDPELGCVVLLVASTPQRHLSVSCSLYLPRRAAMKLAWLLPMCCWRIALSEGFP